MDQLATKVDAGQAKKWKPEVDLQTGVFKLQEADAVQTVFNSYDCGLDINDYYISKEEETYRIHPLITSHVMTFDR